MCMALLDPLTLITNGGSMDKKDVAAGVVVGAVLGALAGVLLAPKSGKETREDLSKFVDSTKEKLAKKLHEMKKVTKEEYDRLVDLVVTEGGETWNVAKEDLDQLRTDLKTRYDEVKIRLADHE